MSHVGYQVWGPTYAELPSHAPSVKSYFFVCATFRNEIKVHSLEDREIRKLFTKETEYWRRRRDMMLVLTKRQKKLLSGGLHTHQW